MPLAHKSMSQQECLSLVSTGKTDQSWDFTQEHQWKRHFQRHTYPVLEILNVAIFDYIWLLFKEEVEETEKGWLM